MHAPVQVNGRYSIPSHLQEQLDVLKGKIQKGKPITHWKIVGSRDEVAAGIHRQLLRLAKAPEGAIVEFLGQETYTWRVPA